MQIEPTGGAGLPATATRHSVDRPTGGAGFGAAMAHAVKHNPDVRLPALTPSPAEPAAATETSGTTVKTSSLATGTTSAASTGTTSAGTTGATNPTDTTSSAGATPAPFNGILVGANGYNVAAQTDPAFAQKVVDETNTFIKNDLARGTNAFGIGGYKFPANAPFGPKNPLFTGQTYGPTWYPGSGKPQPPPSQWPIDPITGLPHDPVTGGSITPSEWATNSWNPDSPSYDPNLYVAAGETPPTAAGGQPPST